MSFRRLLFLALPLALSLSCDDTASAPQAQRFVTDDLVRGEKPPARPRRPGRSLDGDGRDEAGLSVS